MAIGDPESDKQLVRRDGGRVAISGFLYQLVVTLGMITRVVELPTGTDATSSDWELIIAAAREHGVIPELHDADAAIVGAKPGDSALLFQMKYSGTAPPRRIEPEELREICDSFVRQRAALVQTAGCEVSRFVLISNRDLSRDATKAFEAAAEDAPREGETWGAKWSDDQWAILRRVVLLERHYAGYWEDALQRYGASLGATRNETSDGATRLIGEIVREVAGGNPSAVTPARLAKAITDTETARPLHFTDVALISRRSAEEHLRGASGGVPSVPRTSLMDALDRAADRGALIVLFGLGGDGKSIAASQWLIERTRAADAPARAYSNIASAGAIADWARRTFRGWADVAQAPSDWPNRVSIELLVNRCALAVAALQTPESGGKLDLDATTRHWAPLFTLALDGVDEHVVAPAEVGELVRWFSQEHQRMRGAEDLRPRAILLVTCRREEDVADLLRTDTSGFGVENADRYVPVAADKFAVHELRDAAEQLSEVITERIKRALGDEGPLTRAASFASGLVGAESTSGTGGAVFRGLGDAGEESLKPIAPEIVEALRHPAMWGAFRRLPDDEARQGVLDGTEDGKRKLAVEFVRWAVRKWALRRNAKREQMENVVANITAVAELALERGERPSYPKRLWSDAYDVARAYDGGTTDLLRHLNSSGVIELVSSTWKWRHGFLAEAMASQTARDELNAWAAEP